MWIQDEMEKLEESQEKIRKDLSKVRLNVKVLKAQNNRMESMLTAIVQKLDINWEEEDYQAEENEIVGLGNV